MKEIDAVILANGDYPCAPVPLQVLAEAPFVVCCDGAANEHIARGFTPDVIIGDGDSLSEENKQRFAHIVERVSCQETNDQTKAYVSQREGILLNIRVLQSHLQYKQTRE